MPPPTPTDEPQKPSGKPGTLRGIGDTKPVNLVAPTTSPTTPSEAEREAFEVEEGLAPGEEEEDDGLTAGERLLRRVRANTKLQEALAAARAELKPGQRLGEALGDMMFGPEDEVRDVQESERKESVVVTAKVKRKAKLNKEHRDTILEATKALKEASPEALKTASVELGLAPESTSFVGKVSAQEEFQVAATFFDAHYESLPKTVGGRTAQLPIPEAVAKYTQEKAFTDFGAGPNPHRSITGTLKGTPNPAAVIDGGEAPPAAIPEAVGSAPEATGSTPGRRSAPTVPDITAAAAQSLAKAIATDAAAQAARSDGTVPADSAVPADGPVPADSAGPAQAAKLPPPAQPAGAAASRWATQAPTEAEPLDPAVLPSAIAPEVMTTAVNLKAPALEGNGDDDAFAHAGVPSFEKDAARRLKPLWYTLAAIGTVALVVILFRELNTPDDPTPRQPVELTPPVPRPPEQTEPGPRQPEQDEPGPRQPEQDEPDNAPLPTPEPDEAKPADPVVASELPSANSASSRPPPVVPKASPAPVVAPKPTPTAPTPATSPPPRPKSPGFDPGFPDDGPQ